MKPRLIGLAATCAILCLAGCATTDIHSSAAAVAPQYPFACAAMTLGRQGQWAEAQHRWLSAEQSASAANDGGGVGAFAILGVDSGMLAADQYTGGSQTAHLATYQSDLSGDSAYTAGC
jgi:hypothetical protein